MRDVNCSAITHALTALTVSVLCQGVMLGLVQLV